MPHQNRKSRVCELVTRAAIPAASTGMPRPSVLGIDGTAQVCLVAADGTLLRAATGADVIVPGDAADLWVGNLRLTAPGANAVHVLGTLRDGLGNAVVGGVFEIVASESANRPVVPTGVGLGPIVPGFIAGPAADGVSCAGVSGALGAFDITLTTTAPAGTMTVMFRYRHLANILTIVVA